MRALLIVGLFVISTLIECKEVDLRHLKCLVCRATMKELEAEISKADPNILVEVGNYRMDAQGNTIRKKLPLRQSEVYILDVLDDICEKMTDYVRATKKSNNQLIIFNLMSSMGGMNPLMNKVDIIQDGDLNKSLQHYCSGIVEEFEEEIVSLYVNNSHDKKEALCTEISNICNENYLDYDDNDNEIDSKSNNDDGTEQTDLPHDFTFEDKDEL